METKRQTPVNVSPVKSETAIACHDENAIAPRARPFFPGDRATPFAGYDTQ